MKEVPTIKDLMIPVVKALEALGGSGAIQEMADKIIDMLAIPEEIANIPRITKAHDTRTQLQYNTAWARTYLKRCGVLETRKRGVWAIIPGKSSEKINVEEAFREAQRYPYLKRNTDQRNHLGKDDQDSPEPESEDMWRTELSDLLAELSPDAFERLAQRLLRECGFTEVKVTGKSGDGGIDGIGIARLNDIISFPMIFQCKRYKSAVTPSSIRDFRGAMTGRTDKGLFITTSTFTRDAQKEATRDGAPPIDLIDGEQLIDKLKELRMGMKVELVTTEEISIDKDWYQNI